MLETPYGLLEKPEWKALTYDFFYQLFPHEQSIARRFFPFQHLIGRKRNLTVVPSLFEMDCSFRTSKEKKFLASLGIRTHGDFWQWEISSHDLHSLQSQYPNFLESMIFSVLDSIIILPHSWMLDCAWGRGLVAFPLYALQKEDDFRFAVEELLESMYYQRRAVALIERYGLFTGNGKTLRQIAIGWGRTPELVRQLEVRGLRELRTPSYVKELEEILPPMPSHRAHKLFSRYYP